MCKILRVIYHVQYLYQVLASSIKNSAEFLCKTIIPSDATQAPETESSLFFQKTQGRNQHNTLLIMASSY